MKKTLFIMCALALFAGACKKDKTPALTPIQILTNNMVGLWKYDSESNQYFAPNGVPDQPDKSLFVNSSIEFKSTGQEIVILNGGAPIEASWQVLSGTTFKIGTTTYTVKTITATSFIYTSETVAEDNSKTVITYSLSR